LDKGQWVAEWNPRGSTDARVAYPLFTRPTPGELALDVVKP
jgi:hypothetical protein